jgi:transglutaminase-like putative cysteine protease
MIYQVSHTTRITYDRPIRHAQYNLHLMPAAWRGQTMRNYRMSANPADFSRLVASGPYWVVTTQMAFNDPLTSVELVSEFSMEVVAEKLPVTELTLDAIRSASLAARDVSPLAPASYLFPSPIAGNDHAIASWCAPLLRAETGIIENASAVMTAIHREFAYSPGATTSNTPPAEAFNLRQGVCQDFAHIMIIGLRAHGIPAAYASGYLRTLPAPGQQRLVGADAMHAWVNVWCGEELGWLGFDPTNDCLVRENHIQIGMGRDYADVSPIDGVFIGNTPQSMATFVDVAPLNEMA